MLSQVAFELVDDFGVAYEGEGVVVYPHVDAELQVQPILVSDGRQVGALAADVQVTPAGAPEI